MISHIHSTTIYVADQDAALDFYVNTLGWEKALDATVDEGLRWLTVVPPGASTALVLAKPGLAGEENTLATIGGHTGISFVTPDIDATYETLAARGVTFTQPVEVMPWGQKAAWVNDLDGNDFSLLEE